MLAASELKASDPLRVSTFTKATSRGTCTRNSTPKRSSFSWFGLRWNRLHHSCRRDAHLLELMAGGFFGGA